MLLLLLESWLLLASLLGLLLVLLLLRDAELCHVGLLAVLRGKEGLEKRHDQFFEMIHPKKEQIYMLHIIIRISNNPSP